MIEVPIKIENLVKHDQFYFFKPKSGVVNYIESIPVMAAIAVRKKVVSIGHFSPCFYLQSLNFFYLLDQVKSNLYVWIALKIKEK